jgi:hypothetical protein
MARDPEADEIRRIMVPMPDSLHRRVKMIAAERRLTMAEVIREMLEQGVARHQEPPPRPQAVVVPEEERTDPKDEAPGVTAREVAEARLELDRLQNRLRELTEDDPDYRRPIELLRRSMQLRSVARLKALAVQVQAEIDARLAGQPGRRS